LPHPYSGQYADEATPIWWHPEWRDIIVRGGSPYKNPSYDHSMFPDGRSSIDKIVDMGFDGVYLDNVSRATSSVANWTALQTYNNANPGWYLEP
jgi:endo-alpha-1,4-polygalactosaminidase (GH114 family)